MPEVRYPALRYPALRYPALRYPVTDLRSALIADLFGNGEEGVLYDPSDLSTMYQDDKSRTPVTGADQPVSLMLDVSQTLALGAEVPTGTWTISDAGGASGYHSTSPLTFGNATVGTNPGYPRFYTSATFTVGRVYRIRGRMSGDTAAVNIISVGSPLATNKINYDAPTGEFWADAAYVTDDRFFITLNGTTVCEVTIESLSIREIAGNHATAPSDAARSQLRADGAKWRLEDDQVDDALNAQFPSSLGSACTVAYADAAGVTILTGQTIGTSYDILLAQYIYGAVIVDRALTSAETAQATAWLESLR